MATSPRSPPRVPRSPRRCLTAAARRRVQVRCSAWCTTPRTGFTTWTTPPTPKTCCTERVNAGEDLVASPALRRRAPGASVDRRADGRWLAPDLGEHAHEIPADHLFRDGGRVAALQQPVGDDLDPVWNVQSHDVGRPVLFRS